MRLSCQYVDKQDLDYLEGISISKPLKIALTLLMQSRLRYEDDMESEYAPPSLFHCATAIASILGEPLPPVVFNEDGGFEGTYCVFLLDYISRVLYSYDNLAVYEILGHLVKSGILDYESVNELFAENALAVACDGGGVFSCSKDEVHRELEERVGEKVDKLHENATYFIGGARNYANKGDVGNTALGISRALETTLKEIINTKEAQKQTLDRLIKNDEVKKMLPDVYIQMINDVYVIRHRKPTGGHGKTEKIVFDQNEAIPLLRVGEGLVLALKELHRSGFMNS